jgi:sugar/nucleoside kinase (ribokinase family)
MNSSPNVLCVGYVNEDEVIHFDSELEEEKSTGTVSENSVGGGATNTAQILANNSRINNVYLAGCVGKDDRGHRIVSELKSNGVKLVVPRTEAYPTTKIRCFVFEDKKPQYSHEDSEIENVSPCDISDDVWDEVTHLHMTSVSPDMMLEFAEYAQSNDTSISFNPTQGYASDGYQDVIEMADLVQMNRSESETFRERNGPLGTVVDELDTDVVITHGPAGCTMHSKEGVASHSGYPNSVDEVVDTVGAGDTFTAGLLTAWLNDNDLSDCLRTANAYGARAVSVMGAPNAIDDSKVQDIISED